VKQEQRDAQDRFTADQSMAVERIKVPKSSMKAVAMRPPLPPHIAKMPIEIKFPTTHEADLSSLVASLSAVNLQVTFNWSNPTQSEDILRKKLPFLSFQGTVGELLSSLRNGLGIVGWYEDGMIYLSDQQRYSVSLPQNEEVLKSVSEEVKNLGADNVVTSLRGGKLIYTASPTVQDELIGPFLDRMARNLSVISMQVAIVSLSLTDNANTGFDWDKFSVAFNDTKKGISDAAGSDNEKVGEAISATASALTFGKTSLGTVFGKYGALTISGAINFLSNFGNAKVTQNVQLKTLSGSKLTFQDGKEVPYVSGVSSSSSGYSSVGSSDIETVDTGLKVQLESFYDGDSKIVTVGVKVDLNAITQYVELNAGRQLGTISRPIVQKQNIDDLVRVQAGRTVVIGGLQYDSENVNSAEPTVARKALEGTGRTTGSENRKIERAALFIIMRPTVQVFEAED
jgi:type II secretory pathway component GspD/PulD (secretin)